MAQTFTSVPERIRTPVAMHPHADVVLRACPPRVEVTPVLPRHLPNLPSNTCLRRESRAGSEELLRAKPHAAGLHPDGKRHTHALSASRSYDCVSPSLAAACENISRSNRSLVENVRRDVASRTNSTRRERKDTVAVPVQKMPGSRGDPPQYVIDVDSDEGRKPTLLQRSKTFLLASRDGVRKSFRRRTNTAESSKKITVFDPDVDRKPEGDVKTQTVTKTDAEKAENFVKPEVKLQKRSSFKALRKRLFSK